MMVMIMSIKYEPQDVMKYLEKFTYWVIDSPLFKMAFYRKSAVDKIRSLSGTVLDQIIMVKYADDINKKQWISEIIAYFNKIDEIEIKPYNRKFSEIEYLEFLLVEPYCDSKSAAKKDVFIFRKDYTDKIIRKIKKEYNSNIENIDFEFIICFFKKMAIALENNDDLEAIIMNEFK